MFNGFDATLLGGASAVGSASDLGFDEQEQEQEQELDVYGSDPSGCAQGLAHEVVEFEPMMEEVLAAVCECSVCSRTSTDCYYTKGSLVAQNTYHELLAPRTPWRAVCILDSKFRLNFREVSEHLK